VNVAARLEGLADPGGICVSARVCEDVRGSLDVGFEDAGEQQLKNMAWPVRVYRVRLDGAAATARPIPTLPDKPSIAVLAFDNLSGDPEQEYFADGMVEEIIIGLSRLRWLFVIARNSSFTYKGRAVDVKQVGRELGVRYVVEGSVRKSKDKVRIAGQLIDASTGAHLWGDRFEGGLDDIFDLQDRVTANVVSAIMPKLEQAEIERAMRKPTDSLDAYDYYLRGIAGVHRWTRDANNEALEYLYRAIELDPDFALAHGVAARCYSQRKASRWMVDGPRETAEAERLARRAGELGKDDAMALCAAGLALAYVVGDLDGGAAFIDRALVLNPNLEWAWAFSGWVRVWLGEPEIAIEHACQAMRLSPQDPHVFMMQTAIAAAHFVAARYVEALSWAEAAARERPNFPLPTCLIAASSALAGRVPVAEKAVVRLRQIDPTLRISSFEELLPFRQPEAFARLTEGLRNVGFPD
jgi:TolB-like protein/tetratricopeptide (TPR) repeat protein